MKKKTPEEFLIKSKTIHGDKYDYSESVYTGIYKKIKIICKKHGSFKQLAGVHLRGCDCPKCFIDNLKIKYSKIFTNEKFIKNAILIHGDKYDYSKVNYINANSKVNIICSKHGTFLQRPSMHLLCDHGCPTCGYEFKGNNRRKSIDKFIEESNHIHNNRYEYLESEYLGNTKLIKIKCKTHGFFYQTPKNHLIGQGCAECNISKGEKFISELLDKNNLKYKRQFIFKDCRNIKPLRFDFYLSDFNILIEFDGIQHFKSIKYLGGDTGFFRRRLVDSIKNNYCKKYNIPLLRIPYNKNPQLIESDILDFIKNN